MNTFINLQKKKKKKNYSVESLSDSFVRKQLGFNFVKSREIYICIFLGDICLIPIY